MEKEGKKERREVSREEKVAVQMVLTVASTQSIVWIALYITCCARSRFSFFFLPFFFPSLLSESCSKQGTVVVESKKKEEEKEEEERKWTSR